MKQFGGNCLFLNKNDINTDEIIPAKYLTYSERKKLAPHLFEDLCLPDFNHRDAIRNKSVVIARSNFGCGSSREHAVWALEENNITCVIAESFARIFKKNMINCGLLALRLPAQHLDSLWAHTASNGHIAICLEQKLLTFTNTHTTRKYPVALTDFELALINAGGWIDYADKHF